MKKEVKLKANYTIIKAPEKIINKIIKELGCTRKQIATKLRDYKGLFFKDLKIYQGHNVVPLSIRKSLAALISWITVTPTFKANYIALGTDGTQETELDTSLAAEAIRWQFTNRYYLDNVAYLDKFFWSTEVGGNTYLEAGVFIDGTAATNSGFILSRITMDEQIAATETLTINVSVTISW